ncbi:MAG: hypothetical protein GY811_28530 [Myxococcales bacterium]|nr:hypothetical protein [Myxococcales bacterium]
MSQSTKNTASLLRCNAAGVAFGAGTALGIAVAPAYLLVAGAGVAVALYMLLERERVSDVQAPSAAVPLALVDTVFRGSLDQAFQIAEDVKDSSEAGVLQVSESVARIYTDLGNHVRDIDSLKVRMNDENLDNSLASVVSQQRSFLETVPQVLQDIEERTQDLSKTALEAQAHTSDILGLVADISKITKSSKLLAVNALVEAARAGNRGKGFAVVAVTMQNVAEQVSAFSDSIAQIGESMASILPQMATVSDAISLTCADQASHLTSRASTLDEVYDATRSDLLSLMVDLKDGGDHVRTNANQILMELQFQDRIRQELERMQARTRVPLQVLRSLTEEIQAGGLTPDVYQERIWTLVEQVKKESRLETTHSDGAQWANSSGSGDVEMF